MVENKPGGGTNIGTQEMINSALDGDTLLIPSPANAINAALYRQLPFDCIRDTTPIEELSGIAFPMSAAEFGNFIQAETDK